MRAGAWKALPSVARCLRRSSLPCAPEVPTPFASQIGSSSKSLWPVPPTTSHCTSTTSVAAGGIARGWPAAAATAMATLAAVAALGQPALAKEKAPLPLEGEVVLYQYEACPFCNKVKAFLDYRDIPYQVVEVNPVGKKELKFSDYKKVPVVVLDGEQLNDSSAIITELERRVSGRDPKCVDKDGPEERWRRWVDEHLVHLLPPNIYRTPAEALEAFQYITTAGNFTAWERTMAKYTGAVAMYFISGRLKKRHNIINEREDLYKALNLWVEAIGDRDFLGGTKPNLADLAVFGVLRPIRHMQTGREMVEKSDIGPWYRRMEMEVGPSARLAAQAPL